MKQSQAQIHCVHAPRCTSEAQKRLLYVNIKLFYTGPLLNAFFTKHMHRRSALHPVLCPGIQGLNRITTLIQAG